MGIANLLEKINLATNKVRTLLVRAAYRSTKPRTPKSQLAHLSKTAGVLAGADDRTRKIILGANLQIHNDSIPAITVLFAYATRHARQ